MDSDLQNFVQSLVNERPANIGAKENELVKIREKIRKTKAKERKQKQQMKEMMILLRATSDELAFLRSESSRVRNELQALDDHTADWNDDEQSSSVSSVLCGLALKCCVTYVSTESWVGINED